MHAARVGIADDALPDEDGALRDGDVGQAGLRNAHQRRGADGNGGVERVSCEEDQCIIRM